MIFYYDMSAIFNSSGGFWGLRQADKNWLCFFILGIYFIPVYSYPYLLFPQMNKILLILLITTSSLCLKLQIGDKIILQQSYPLSCTQTTTRCSYQVDNLPQGLRLINSAIEVVDARVLSTVVFPINVKIKVWDQSGATNQRVVTLMYQGTAGPNVANLGILQGSGTNLRNAGIMNVSVVMNSQNNNNQIYNKQVSLRSSFTLPTGTNNLQYLTPGIPNSRPSQPQPNPPNPPLNPSQPSRQQQARKIMDQLNVPTPQGPSPQLQALNNRVSNMPTSPDSNLINPVPSILSAAKAAPSDSNRNKITVDKVKENIAFQRQDQANKAAANLYEILKRSIANRNNAQQEFVRLLDVYTSVREKQQRTNSTASQTESQYGRLNLALKNLLLAVTQIKKKLQSLDVQTRQKTLQKQSLTSGIQSASTKVQNMKSQLADLQRKAKTLKQQKQAKDEQCSILERELRNIQLEGDGKIAEMRNVTGRVAPAKGRVQAAKRVAEDLRERLRKAEGDLREAEVAFTQIQTQQQQLKNYFLNYQSKINDARNRNIACPQKSTQLSQKLTQLQTTQTQSLQLQIQNAQQQTRKLSDKLNQTTSELNNLPKLAQQFRQQLKVLEPRVQIIRDQISISQGKIMEFRGARGDVDDQVRVARENLEAVKKRFEDQNKNVETASKNLEFARSEKQMADLEVDMLYQQTPNTNMFVPINFQEAINMRLAKNATATPSPQAQNPAQSPSTNTSSGSSPSATSNNPNAQNQIEKQIARLKQENQRLRNQINQVQNNNGASGNNRPNTPSNQKPQQNQMPYQLPTNIMASRPPTQDQNKTAEVPQQTQPQQQQQSQTQSYAMPQTQTQAKPKSQPIIELSQGGYYIKQSDYKPPQILIPKHESQNSQLFRNQLLDVLSSNNDGTYIFKNMPEFVLRFFGKSISPPVNVRSSTLYPIPITTPNLDPQISRLLGLNKIGVQPNLPFSSNIGTIISLVGSTLKILPSESNDPYQYIIAPQTRLFATDPKLKLQAGNRVMVRAIDVGVRKGVASLLIIYAG